jgi:hypothetical protein
MLSVVSDHEGHKQRFPTPFLLLTGWGACDKLSTVAQILNEEVDRARSGEGGDAGDSHRMKVTTLDLCGNL